MATTVVFAAKKLAYRSETYEKGAKVPMFAEDVDAHLHAELILLADASEASVPAEMPKGLEGLKAMWELETSPQEYLKLYPEGPHSDLALSIVEAEAEAGTPTA